MSEFEHQSFEDDLRRLKPREISVSGDDVLYRCGWDAAMAAVQRQQQTACPPISEAMCETDQHAMSRGTPSGLRSFYGGALVGGSLATIAASLLLLAFGNWTTPQGPTLESGLADNKEAETIEVFSGNANQAPLELAVDSRAVGHDADLNTAVAAVKDVLTVWKSRFAMTSPSEPILSEDDKSTGELFPGSPRRGVRQGWSTLTSATSLDPDDERGANHNGFSTRSKLDEIL